MYAHVKDGSVDYMGSSLPKNWDNVSNLHLSDGNDAYLKTIGWFPIVETNVTPTYNQTFDTDIVTIEEDRVLLIHRVRSMTAQEKSDRDASHLRAVRKGRNEKLIETDFHALNDRPIPMSSDMATYRQALRDLPETADMTKWNTADWTWPTLPA
jgi:transcriptional regulator of met regulon